MTQETREAIGKVRALIMSGWTRGALVMRDETGQDHYCLMGAIGEVFPGRGGVTPEYKAVYDAITSHGIKSLIEWNDAPGRTQEDVLRLLDSVLEGA